MYPLTRPPSLLWSSRRGLPTDVSRTTTCWNVYATCGRSAASRGAKGIGTTADVQSADRIRTSRSTRPPRVELLGQPGIRVSRAPSTGGSYWSFRMSACRDCRRRPCLAPRRRVAAANEHAAAQRSERRPEVHTSREREVTAYRAFTHASEPVSLTDTSEKDTRTGLPSAVPRRSSETRSGPAFL